MASDSVYLLKYLKYKTKYKSLQENRIISNQITGGDEIVHIDECPICYENRHLYSIFQCTHLICISCIIIDLLGVYTDGHFRSCPLCRSNIDDNKHAQLIYIIRMRINNLELSNPMSNPISNPISTSGYTTLYTLSRQIGNYINRPNLIAVRRTIGLGIGISVVFNINTIVGGLYKLFQYIPDNMTITPTIDNVVWHPLVLGITYYPAFEGIILPRINNEIGPNPDINDIIKKTIRNLSICLVLDIIPVIIRWTIGITSERQIEIINGLLYRIGSQFMRGGGDDSSDNIIINNDNYEQFKMNTIKLYNNLDKYNSNNLYCTTYIEIYDKQKINSTK